jgi:3-(3-hydroxy-phenyl)propionate hydroxylase
MRHRGCRGWPGRFDGSQPSRRGRLRVAVFERNSGLLGLPRAIAYDAETLRLFAQIGLLDEIAPGLVQDPPVRHLNALGKALMQAKFPRSIYGHSPLGTFYQPEFEKTLLKGLTRFSNVSIAFPHAAGALAQAKRGVTLTVSTRDGDHRVRAAYVVACDGGTSGVRESLGVKLMGSTYTERWLVVDAIVPNHHVSEITFRCDPRRPTVELPGVGDRVRWEFMQLPGESEEELSRDETFARSSRKKRASTRSRSSARLSMPSMPASPTVGASAEFSLPATPPISCRLSRGRE